MRSASRLFYGAAGRPLQAGDVAGICRLCGQEGPGESWAAWVYGAFLPFDQCFPGSICCHACQWSCSERSPELAERVGAETPKRLRSYSHFLLQGIWQPLGKGSKRRMAELLLQEPEVACISFEGKKHLLCRMRPGFWQVEEAQLRPCPDLLRTLLVTITALLAQGFSKAEIETGHYQQRRLMACDLALWREAEGTLASVRTALPFRLALWLAQAPEVN